MTQGKGAQRIKPEKVQFVEELTGKLAKSRALILTDYRGMTVKEITEFRKNLRREKGEYQVVKNRLFLRSLQHGREVVDPLSGGPLALVTAEGDPYVVVKTLYQFVKETEKPVVKGGFLDNIFFGENDLKKLSRLPSRTELLAQVARGAQAPLTRFVSVLTEVMRSVVRVVSEIQKKKEVESK